MYHIVISHIRNDIQILDGLGKLLKDVLITTTTSKLSSLWHGTLIINFRAVHRIADSDI